MIKYDKEMTLCIITTKYDIFIKLCNFIVRLVARCRNLKKLQICRFTRTHEYVLICLCTLSSYLYRNTLIFGYNQYNRANPNISGIQIYGKTSRGK